ncbi:hypothetical protein IH601_10660 [Candidatus Bipolaricaulota bacterium]|nr:hypothetical protein [Candidatus Bipolaricaulota bacterium]TFH07950.1 MAG: hypothetical protein E4H08_08660 [Candidatus Atribacteria bacterium]
MKGTRLVQVMMLTMALLGVLALGVSAAEATCQCFDSAFRVGGGIADYPASSGNLKLEFAMGLPELSAAVWTDMASLPMLPVDLGAELKLARDWLSIRLVVEQPSDSPMELSLVGQAAPSSWLLFDGMPTLLAGITANVETELFGGTGKSEVLLAPFLTGVIPAGGTTVSPSIGIDLSLDSENQSLDVAGSRLVSTVHAGCVLIASTVHFSGLYEAFSALVISLTVPEWGLSASGSLIPTPAGGFTYRISVGYEWGDTYLLTEASDKPGAVCTGGVCF